MHYLGIDISKRKFDVCLLKDSAQPSKRKNKTFENSASGFVELLEWLTANTAEPVHAAVEATNVFHEALAEFLHSRGVTVSVVNPARTKYHGVSLGVRTKTDRADANVIASYCATHRPDAWTPPPAHLKELKELVARLDSLMAAKGQEEHRLLTSSTREVQKSLKASLRFLDKQIAEMQALIRSHIDNHPDLREQSELLKSIPGVGETTASILLALLPSAEQTRSARQWAAFAGLTPREHQSGQFRGRARLSKTGSSRLRRALYMPAVVATRANPVVREFYQRLLTAGKTKMCAIGACMRKLLHIAFGVLKHQCPFSLHLQPNP